MGAAGHTKKRCRKSKVAHQVCKKKKIAPKRKKLMLANASTRRVIFV
jgi:hypothetical protein